MAGAAQGSREPAGQGANTAAKGKPPEVSSNDQHGTATAEKAAGERGALKDERGVEANSAEGVDDEDFGSFVGGT